MSRNDAIAALVRFVDLEATSVEQALTIAGEDNDQNAEKAQAAGDRSSVQVLRSSAASRRKKPARFAQLVDALPDDLD